MRSNRVFTDEQEQWIYDNAKGTGNVELTNKFNEHFGEHRQVKQFKSWKSNHKVSSGLTGWFEKGRVDEHKGDHSFRIPNSEKTRFKKGHCPKNHLPVGTIVKTTDGYFQTKVAEPNKWKLTHRLIWEEANGPIPKDYTVTFLDKNKENLELSNLALLSRRAQLVAQHHYGLSEDQEISKSVIQLSELQVKRNSLHKRIKEESKE